MSSTSIYPEENLQIPSAYVYKIIDKETSEFYIGSRISESVRNLHTPEQDILIKYFSSGKLKSKIKENPDNYIVKILFRSNESIVLNGKILYIVYYYEQLLIKENISNPLCANKHFVDSDTNQQAFNRTGAILSEETKSKISKSVSMLPKPSKDRIKKSQDSLRRLRLNPEYKHPNSGITRDDEYKQKLSMWCKASTKLKNKSPEWNNKNSISNMGRKHIANTITKIRRRIPKDAAAALIESNPGVWIYLSTHKSIPDFIKN